MLLSALVIFGTQALTCGYDGGEPAAPEEYDGAFQFTGIIKRITADLSGDLISDSETDMKIVMMRQ